MKKLESSLTNMTVSLVAVAIMVGSLLTWVNHITATPIKIQEEKVLADGIKSVMGGTEQFVTAEDSFKQKFNGKELLFVIHKTIDTNGQPSGAAVESLVDAFGGAMKVLVGFDVSGNILGYTILLHSETPGLGAKADTWFKKGAKGDIIGKNPAKDDFKIDKDGGSVDAITASTITSRAFLRAIKQAYNAYSASFDGVPNKQNSIDGQSSASEQVYKLHDNNKGHTTASIIE